MPTRPKSHRPYPQRRPPDNRPTAAKRGYDARWQRARLAFLQKHPLCEECLKGGRPVPATVVDHRIPHRGDMELFWDTNNWSALCAHHHNVKTAKGQ